MSIGSLFAVETNGRLPADTDLVNMPAPRPGGHAGGRLFDSDDDAAHAGSYGAIAAHKT